jgi:hypothetical protein
LLRGRSKVNNFHLAGAARRACVLKLCAMQTRRGKTQKNSTVLVRERRPARS